MRPIDNPTPLLPEWKNEIDARRSALATRLEDGYRRIDQALPAGEDVTGWETFWIHLLDEYEGVCNELGAEPIAA